MKVFTAVLPVTVEVTIEAKNKKQALSFLDDLYLNIFIEKDGDQEIEILGDNLDLIENNWQLED